jgi:hypothetical protein
LYSHAQPARLQMRGTGAAAIYSSTHRERDTHSLQQITTHAHMTRPGRHQEYLFKHDMLKTNKREREGVNEPSNQRSETECGK